MDEPMVAGQKRKRSTYRKPGCKEVTTRMPIELAAAVRDAAVKQGMTVNDYMITLAHDAVRDDRQLGEAAKSVHLRMVLQRALAQLNEEELPVSA